jgi:Flp pilus assembly protein TadD
MSDPKFEAYIRQLYERLTVRKIDYFTLLGLQRTATHKEIETNYQKYAQYFSPQRVALLTDPELKRMGDFVSKKINRAHEILTNYDKKAEYEKRGFREYSAELDNPEEEPEEQAKTIYKKAKSLHTSQQYQLGVKAMEEAIRLDPKVASYYLLLGICQAQIPHLKIEAEKNLRKASEMESWNAEPYVALGMLFYSEKLNKKAEPYFRKALELENNHALAKKKLAEIAVPEETIVDKAKDVLKKALPSIFGRKK